MTLMVIIVSLCALTTQCVRAYVEDEDAYTEYMEDIMEKIDTQVRWDSYYMLNLTISGEADGVVLDEMNVRSDSIQILNDHPMYGANNVLIVAPHKLADVLEILRENEIEVSLVNNNVQILIDEESIQLRKLGKDKMTWAAYYPLPTIYLWMDDVVKEHPEASIVVVGKSFEGRPIKGIYIASNPGSPAIFIEAGIHAREWGAVSAATYVIKRILDQDDDDMKYLFENYDWYIVPVLNVDGYVYSHDINRFWRKTRKPYGVCAGADLNRNWDYNWNAKNQSSNSCFWNYVGVEAESEIEVKSFSTYLKSLSGKLKTYISLHEFGNLIMYHYDKTSKDVSEPDLKAISVAAIDAIQEYENVRYDSGTLDEKMLAVCGDVLGWVYENMQDLKMAFSFELRPYAFIGREYKLAADQVIPTNMEMIDALVALVRKADELGYYE